jgi:hypothetical protein
MWYEINYYALYHVIIILKMKLKKKKIQRRVVYIQINWKFLEKPIKWHIRQWFFIFFSMSNILYIQINCCFWSIEGNAQMTTVLPLKITSSVAQVKSETAMIITWMLMCSRDRDFNISHENIKKIIYMNASYI